MNSRVQSCVKDMEKGGRRESKRKEERQQKTEYYFFFKYLFSGLPWSAPYRDTEPCCAAACKLLLHMFMALL